METETTWAPNQRRRVSKPLIEKRRRARINRSLSQLVEMVAKPDKVQDNRSARLEKAYILEMTVEYLRKSRDSRILPEKSFYDDYENSFQAGYRLCMTEVQNFLDKNSDKKVPEEFLTKSLQRHLGRKLKSQIKDCSTSSETQTNFPSKLTLGSVNPKKRETCIRQNSENRDLLIKRSKMPYSSLDSCSSTSSASTEDESTMCASESESSGGEGHIFYYSKNLVQTRDVSNNDLISNANEGPVWRPW